MAQAVQGNFFPNTYIASQMCVDDTDGYIFELLSVNQTAICPACDIKSSRYHSYQDRIVKDLPILGKAVTLLIAQRRFYCDNEGCETDIFTEQNDFVSPYYQFTERCREYMLKVATLASCEAASKILKYQGIKVSGDTLIRILKAAGDAYPSKYSTKIGVDDWAYHKGQTYGTIICDMETHEVIDVLEGRDKETFEKWLYGHPEIEMVSRDRGSAYAAAVNDVLPEAIQIADRFHITKNLLEALEDTMKTFMPETVEVPNNPIANPVEMKYAVKKTKRSIDKLRKKSVRIKSEKST